jgi:hypothetical protein
VSTGTSAACVETRQEHVVAPVDVPAEHLLVRPGDFLERKVALVAGAGLALPSAPGDALGKAAEVARLAEGITEQDEGRRTAAPRLV